MVSCGPLVLRGLPCQRVSDPGSSALVPSRFPPLPRSRLWLPWPLALFTAAVLCQAILILFADLSVLDGCKI